MVKINYIVNGVVVCDLLTLMGKCLRSACQSWGRVGGTFCSRASFCMLDIPCFRIGGL